MKLLAIEFFLGLFLLLNIFVLNIKSLYFLSGILFLFLIGTILLLGYERNRQRFKKDIILNIVIATFVFQILLYLSGLFLGFVKNGYSLTFIHILKNIFPVFLIIIISELLRYCLNVKGQKQKWVLVISTLIFILIDVSLQIHLYELQNKKEIFELFSYIILPSISKNILLTYFSVKFGYGAGIIYRFIMELPLYFMPIFPDLNVYLRAVLNFVFPLLLFYLSYRKIDDEEEKESVREKKIFTKVVGVICIILFIGIVSLTSGVFSIYALVIGSGSMSPEINKGDVVIIKKIPNPKISSLEKGDVMAFQYEKKVIVHRIQEIHEVNDNYTFQTKGDNNETTDGWIIDEKKVIGKVIARVPWVGYPTVWLNEALN